MDLTSLLFSENEESTSSSSSSSEDYDEDDEIFLENIDFTQSKTFKNNLDDYLNYSEEDFRKHYRISKSIFEEIDSHWKTSGYLSLAQKQTLTSSTKHLAVFLWFAGHKGCTYRHLAQHFNLSLWTVNNIICRVSVYLSNMAQDVISWPRQIDQMKTKSHYEENKDIPNVMGVIGCTHIKIDHPRKNVDQFVNTKGEYSIVMQGVCNEDAKFLDVSVGCPGSSTETEVLKKSKISEKMFHLGCYLVGDAGLPCMTWLMVPYKDSNVLSYKQRMFNALLNECQFDIHLTFAMVKKRFPQLHHCKVRNIKYLCHFIKACCVLHNLADKSDFAVEEDSLVLEEPIPCFEDSEDGKRLRNEICKSLNV